MFNIKNWIKFNEGKSNVDDIIDDLNDILLELNDQGFNCRVSNNLELPPVYDNNIPKGYKLVRTHDVIIILFSKEERPGFYFNDIKETYYRIKSYLIDNGYLEEDDFESSFLNREQKWANNRILSSSAVGGLLYTSVSFKKEL